MGADLVNCILYSIHRSYCALTFTLARLSCNDVVIKELNQTDLLTSFYVLIMYWLYIYFIYFILFTFYFYSLYLLYTNCHTVLSLSLIASTPSTTRTMMRMMPVTMPTPESTSDMSPIRRADWGSVPAFWCATTKYTTHNEHSMNL